MAKHIQFKPPHGSMTVPTIGLVHNGNITPELYARLVSENPAHADFFHEVEIPTPKPPKGEAKEEKKSNKNKPVENE
jgi:hypothetical protein